MPTKRPAPSKACFVIAPIGKPDSDTRTRSDLVFEHILLPVLTSRGYTPKRADHLEEPGLITDHVIEHIVGDDLVVADLSEHNPNVFYELAIRHIVRKPLVQIIQAGEAIPFDIASMLVIELDHRNLASVASAQKSIDAQIRATEKDPAALRSPLSNISSLMSMVHRDSYDAERWVGHHLHHVSLPVSNLARSVQFYTDVLGLREVERPELFSFGGAWFLLPSGQQLHILESETARYRHPGAGVDYRDAHFAIRVFDYRATKQHLAECGYKLEEFEELRDGRYVGGYLLDPDNYVIEINTGNYAEIAPRFVR